MRKLLSLQQLPNLSYVPDASYAGTMYHSTTDSRLYVSNGTAWKKIAFVDEIASVTEANIIAALGYTPADEAVLGDIQTALDAINGV